MTRTTQQVLTNVECRCVLLWLAQALLTYICQLSGLLAVPRRLHVRYLGRINISNLSRTCVHCMCWVTCGMPLVQVRDLQMRRCRSLELIPVPVLHFAGVQLIAAYRLSLY